MWSSIRDIPFAIQITFLVLGSVLLIVLLALFLFLCWKLMKWMRTRNAATAKHEDVVDDSAAIPLQMMKRDDKHSACDLQAGESVL